MVRIIGTANRDPMLIARLTQTAQAPSCARLHTACLWRIPLCIALANALVKRTMIADPNGTSKQGPGVLAETRGNVTTFYGAGIAGSGTLEGLPGVSPDIARMIEVFHEGMHGSPTNLDNWEAGYKQDWLTKHPGFHQLPFNQEAYRILFQH